MPEHDLRAYRIGMLRHIIVEGPDASGKDGLINRMRPVFVNHTVHERASTSKGGPVPYLTQWVTDDVRRMRDTGPWIYNRHPLISEPIYAPIARNAVPQGSLGDPLWHAQMTAEAMKHSLVVWCMPPRAVVLHNVSQTAGTHMPGVADNIGALYDAYRTIINHWPGRITMLWDYTTGDFPRLCMHLAKALGIVGTLANPPLVPTTDGQ